jgi:peptidoglycan/LPS O-acetylase OafA/YrhL
MRAALVILLLVATSAIFQSRSWGWQTTPAAVAALSQLTLSGALAGTSELIASWRAARRKSRIRPFLLNGVAALAALAIWLNYVLTELAESEGSPTQRGLLALALAWMISPFAGLALTKLGERLTRRSVLKLPRPK